MAIILDLNLKFSHFIQLVNNFNRRRISFIYHATRQLFLRFTNKFKLSFTDEEIKYVNVYKQRYTIF